MKCQYLKEEVDKNCSRQTDKGWILRIYYSLISVNELKTVDEGVCPSAYLKNPNLCPANCYPYVNSEEIVK